MVFFLIYDCAELTNFKKNETVSLLSLQDIKRWFEEIKAINFKNKRTGIVKRTLPFKEGWLITLMAVQSLINELFELEGISFVLTRRLNQDPLEVS